MGKSTEPEAEILAAEENVKRLEALLAKQKHLERVLATDKVRLRQVYAQRYELVERAMPADFDPEKARLAYEKEQKAKEAKYQADLERGKEERFGVDNTVRFTRAGFDPFAKPETETETLRRRLASLEQLLANGNGK